jgi:hypothetical protein
MSAPPPTYSVEQLAPGSYDVLLDGALVAAFVHGINGLDDGWRIDPLDEALSSDRTPLFSSQSHTFRSLPAALDWLGIRERGISDAQVG